MNPVNASSSIVPIHKPTKKVSVRITNCLRQVIHTITAIFTEFSAMIYSAAILYRGKKKPYQYAGLNPQSLTKEQADLPAIVSLPGLFHNPTGSNSLAREFQREHISPFFAPHVKYDTKSPEKHHEVLRKNLKEIRALYDQHNKPCKLICIGHSYGLL